MNALAAVAAGVVFALGLGISGMTDASKVLAFLDVSGDWDPSLALVMAGAIGAHLPAALAASRDSLRKPLFAASFQLPSGRGITPRLFAGAAVFGVGWGISGYCPGPAVVSAATGAGPALVYLAAMSVGMALYASVERRNATKGSQSRAAAP